MEEKVIFDLVLNYKISLRELETSYNLDDLYRLLAVIEANNEVEKFLMKEQQTNVKRH